MAGTIASSRTRRADLDLVFCRPGGSPEDPNVIGRRKRMDASVRLRRFDRPCLTDELGVFACRPQSIAWQSANGGHRAIADEMKDLVSQAIARDESAVLKSQGSLNRNVGSMGVGRALGGHELPPTVWPAAAPGPAGRR